MQKLSDQEMETLLRLIGGASPDQLKLVFAKARSTSDIRSRQAVVGISVGSRVKWNGKYGTKTGVVKHVKQKYVEVTEDGSIMVWNVPASMLTVVP